MVKAPPLIVTLLLALVIDRLPKVSPPVLVMLCADVPLKLIVLVEGVNVPLSVQLPETYKVVLVALMLAPELMVTLLKLLVPVPVILAVFEKTIVPVLPLKVPLQV